MPATCPRPAPRARSATRHPPPAPRPVPKGLAGVSPSGLQKWPPRAPARPPNALCPPRPVPLEPVQVHPLQWIYRFRFRLSAGSGRRETPPGRVPPRHSSRPPVPATLDEIIRGFASSNDGEICLFAALCVILLSRAICKTERGGSVFL